MSIITKPGFYRQRNGGKAEIVAIRNGMGIGFRPIDSRDSPFAWDTDGSWFTENSREDENDIIGPWFEEPFRISDHGIGVYQNRKGQEVTITSKCGPEGFPWIGRPINEDGTTLSWSDTGRWCYEESDDDLIHYLRPLDEWKPVDEWKMRPPTGADYYFTEPPGPVLRRWTCGDKSEWRPVEVTK